ncbi:MAG: class I SAM-dependent methyltransferase, partial [Firmicutes bacterium]|nr:class I SAM-dependent methyltransferase [Bacillota bacterium]
LIKPMGFKHTGLFPEQAANWDKMADLITKAKQSGKKDISVLNLFAYTGGASIACAAAGAKVTHIDSAKGMVERAGNNAKLSGVGDKVRLIIDDCKKFVLREIKRGNRYDAILMDPPSYGRGPDGQMWKLEDNLFDLVKLTTQVLSDNPIFFLINSYTTGLQPTVIGNILSLALKHKKGSQSAYELVLPTSEGIFLPCGCSGLWVGE